MERGPSQTDTSAREEGGDSGCKLGASSVLRWVGVPKPSPPLTPGCAVKVRA